MKIVRKLVPWLALPLLLGCLLTNYVDTATAADTRPNQCSRDCSTGAGALSLAIVGRAV